MLILAAILALIISVIIFRYPFFGLLILIIFEYIKIGILIPALGKIHLVRIIAIFLLISIVFKLLDNTEKMHLEVRSQNLAQLLFFYSMALSAFMAYVGSIALRIFMLHLRTVVLYFCIVLLLNSSNRFKKFISVLIASVLFLTLWGLTLYMRKGCIDNILGGGFLSGADDFALGINIVLPLPFFLFLSQKRVIKLILGCITGSFVVGVILLNSRGGFVTLIGISFLALLMNPHKKITLLYLIIGLVCVLLFAPPQFFSEFLSITPHEATAQNRLEMWQGGIKMFLDYPLIGVGPGNFSRMYPRFYLPKNPRSTVWKVAHSDYITVLSELGLLGSFFFFLIIYYIIKENLYLQKKLELLQLKGSFFYIISKALITSLAGYLIGSLFITCIYYPHLYIIAGLTESLKYIVEKEIIMNHLTYDKRKNKKIYSVSSLSQKSTFINFNLLSLNHYLCSIIWPIKSLV